MRIALAPDALAQSKIGPEGRGGFNAKVTFRPPRVSCQIARQESLPYASRLLSQGVEEECCFILQGNSSMALVASAQDLSAVAPLRRGDLLEW